MYECYMWSIYFKNVYLILKYDQNQYGWIFKINAKYYVNFNEIYAINK